MTTTSPVFTNSPHYLMAGYMADLVKAESLTGEDVYDLHTHIDWDRSCVEGYECHYGTDSLAHNYLLAATAILGESAADFMQTVTESVLGW